MKYYYWYNIIYYKSWNELQDQWLNNLNSGEIQASTV